MNTILQCCDKDCPPCDKVCGKTLSCNKHKCSALCHRGQCYPCPQRSIVKCRCGQTSVEVACGREKQTRPPKCSQPCRLASKCHHSTPHRCHPGECPTCCQPCAQPNDTTRCQHACMERCHDAVRIALVDRNFKPAGPWEKAPEKVSFKGCVHLEKRSSINNSVLSIVCRPETSPSAMRVQRGGRLYRWPRNGRPAMPFVQIPKLRSSMRPSVAVRKPYLPAGMPHRERSCFAKSNLHNSLPSRNRKCINCVVFFHVFSCSKTPTVRRVSRNASAHDPTDVCIRARKPATWDRAPSAASTLSSVAIVA